MTPTGINSLSTSAAVDTANNPSLSGAAASMPDRVEENVIPAEILEVVVLMIQEMLGLFESGAQEEDNSGFSLDFQPLPSYADSSSGSSYFSDAVVPQLSLGMDSDDVAASTTASSAKPLDSLFDGLPDLPSLTGGSASLSGLNSTASSAATSSLEQASMLGNLPDLPSLMGNNTSLPVLPVYSSSSASSSSVFDAPGIPNLMGSFSSDADAPAQASNSAVVPGLPSLTGGSSMDGGSSAASSTSSASTVADSSPSQSASSTNSGSLTMPSLTGSGDLSVGSGFNIGVPSLVGDEGLRFLSSSAAFSVEDLDEALDDLQITSVYGLGNNTGSHWR